MSTEHHLKRRRERDRPKHHPGAAYNPNERVILSYESDEDTPVRADIETETQVAASPSISKAVTTTPAPVRSQVDYRSDEIQEQDFEQPHDDKAQHDNGRWRKKRKNNHHNRNPQYSDQHYKSHDDTGQWPALGGGVVEEEDGNDSDATQDEAMAYLNSVRLERESLPTTVTASRFEDLYAEYEDESTAVFSDGVYAVRPSFGPSLPPEYKRSITAMEAYTRSLLSRFDKMHEALQQTSENTDVEAYEYWPGDDEEDKAWLLHITQETPNHAQLSKMQPDMALDLLDLIGRTLFKVSEVITASLGAWILSFFARLDSYGQLHMEKISRLREFAQAAEKILVKVHSNARDSQQEEQMAGVQESQDTDTRAEGDAEEQVMSDVDEAELTTDDTPNKDPSDLIAILDMVLTIVGERFGQRDLLELRIWPTDCSHKS